MKPCLITPHTHYQPVGTNHCRCPAEGSSVGKEMQALKAHAHAPCQKGERGTLCGWNCVSLILYVIINI